VAPIFTKYFVVEVTRINHRWAALYPAVILSEPTTVAERSRSMRREHSRLRDSFAPDTKLSAARKRSALGAA
jgi:hypothetical protein